MTSWATSIRFDRFYPLIAYETQHFVNGNTSRSVVMNPTITRFPEPVLRRLYARQVGKLLSRRMKNLMDLPYGISGMFDDLVAEAEYHEHGLSFFQVQRGQKAAKGAIDAEMIEMDEEVA